MAKWIKNDSGTTKTWVGQQVTDQSYYEIQSNEELKWMNDSDLLSDIGSGDAVVAKDDSGSNDITDVNNAINHLKDHQPLEIDSSTAPIRLYGIPEAHSLRARLLGFINQTLTKNQSNTIDWLIPQTSYQGTNKQAYMSGLDFCVSDAEMGDNITFQVVDIDDILGYGANTVFDEFGTNWYVMPGSPTTITLYKAKLIPGLYIRLIYTSVGTTTDPKIVCNLFRHIDADVDV